MIKKQRKDDVTILSLLLKSLSYGILEFLYNDRNVEINEMERIKYFN